MIFIEKYFIAMDKAKNSTSRLLTTTVLDPKDELDERLERCYVMLTSITKGLSERDSNDALQAHVCQGSVQHEEVQLGLFAHILFQPTLASRCYRDMTLISRDLMNAVLTRANQIVHEKWTKIKETPRKQLLWLVGELVSNKIRGADSVCHSLIRQIAGGDVSPRNVWLAETLLDILTDNKAWLEKHPALLAGAVYTYLRLIVDHGAPSLQQLRQREVEFCVSTMREKWSEVAAIGRDLVRLLQYIARVPEIEQLWNDLLHRPAELSPDFKGVQQLMQTRTSRWYFKSRLTPDMENKLAFLTTKVRFGEQKRYQEWFQRQYLSTPESQSLRYDLIRYICAVIHPTNEALCSDVIPRWAVIGWLLTTCTSNVAASNAKLSLFYDWLFFDKEKDSIMNIEPCILVMFHSMRPHPAITATLLDFMCRIMKSFYPPLGAQIKQGVFSALHTIVEKGVLPSLTPLFDNAKLDKELRIMIRENFSDFCSEGAHKEVVMGPDSEVEASPASHLPGMVEKNSLLDLMPGNDMHAEFSDEEEDRSPPEKTLGPETLFRPIPEQRRRSLSDVDISDWLEQLEGHLRNAVLELHAERDSNELQCEMMDRLIQCIIQEEFDADVASCVAAALCAMLQPSFTETLYPLDPDDESIEDSICSPLYVIFRNVCQTSDEDPARHPILLLLEEMYLKQPRLGYHFLYFLKVSKVHDERMMAYKDFCLSLENKDMETCLQTDLALCAQDDVRLFTFLIPDIYTQFDHFAVGNAELLHLIVSHIDGTQLQDLVCQILLGHFVMFKKDSFVSILNASLDWETLEQYFLWQLISAHNIPVEHIMPILPKLEFNTHAEALSSVLVLLKQDGPSTDLMWPILCRNCKRSDLFAVSILKFWAQEYDDKLAEILHVALTRSGSTPNRKRKGGGPAPATKREKDAPTAEQVLAHLEHMRQTCRNNIFLMHEEIQAALQHIHLTGSDTLKTRFSELLALAEDIDEQSPRGQRVLRAVPSRRASQAGGLLNSKVSLAPVSSNRNKRIDSDSSSESSEDEDMSKPKPKKRKKVLTVNDDSDG